MKIFFLCPDTKIPVGGIKQIYRHVDILDRNGYAAFVLHQEYNFRVDFFENHTPIANHKNIFNEPKIKGAVSKAQNFLEATDMRVKSMGGNIETDCVLREDDILVIPEVYGPQISRIASGLKKIIFNQNANYTFNGYSFRKNEVQTPYKDLNVMATLVISEHSREYLSYAIPSTRIFRMHNGIDARFFYCNPQKKPLISFMSRKLQEDSIQVINILKQRHALDGFEIVAIDNATEREVSKILRDSLFFLSFSDQEGCPLPPMEAMACGCVVIGYTGYGGDEYFLPEFCYPVAQRDILSFSKTVENVLNAYRKDPQTFLDTGQKASKFILREYSMERESRECLTFWKDVLKGRS